MSNRVKKFFTPGKILAIVAAFCALLIVVSFFSDRLVTPLRGAVSQVIIPIQRGMNGIGIGVVNRENEKRNIEDLQEENRELKDTIALLEEENKQLKHDTKDFTDVTDVESVAVWNDEAQELTVFAVNRDLQESITLESDLRAFPGYTLKEHLVLEHPDFKAVNSAAAQTVAPKAVTDRDELADGTLKSVLSPASWNVIRLVKA